MRRLILAFAASTLALAGCDKEEAAGNTAAVDQAVSAEDFVAADATAIDAATGADANMAADVDINLVEQNAASNGSAPATGRRPAPPSPTPVQNSSANEQPAAEQAEPAVESNSD